MAPEDACRQSVQSKLAYPQYWPNEFVLCVHDFLSKHSVGGGMLFLAVGPPCQPTPLCLSLTRPSAGNEYNCIRNLELVQLSLFLLLCVEFRGGQAFSKSCSLTKEPEDVTVGFIIGRRTVSVSLILPLFHRLPPPCLHDLYYLPLFLCLFRSYVEL